MRPVGMVLLAIGIVLLLFGLNSSQAPTEQVVEFVKGRYTDNTMMYIIGGIGMIVGGAALTVFGRK